MSNFVLARVQVAKGDDVRSWASYPFTTHVEAARQHAEKFPFKSQIIETCWAEPSLASNKGTIFKHFVVKKTVYEVTPLRSEESNE